MKIKRTVLCILCVVILVLTGCAKETTVTKGGVAVSAPNEFPITEEPVTLKIFSPAPVNVADLETNEFTEWFKEKTNVQIKWELANGDTRQAINLKLASQDYGDIWYGFYFARSEQVAYYEQGVFADMTDLVDKHGYYIKQMFEKEPEIEKEIRHTDNKILGLPRAVNDFLTYAGNVMWVYQPWMEKLGLENPETTEDFYNMLKAFKEKDPNGNGIADEIPLAGRKDRGSNVSVDSYIMSAFAPFTRTGLYNNNGKAAFAPIGEDYREGVRYLRRLYQEGLLHADNFIMDRARVMALTENDVPILGAVPGSQQGYFTVLASPSGRATEYVPIAPLKGPGGLQQTQAPLDWNSGLSFFNITQQCKNPEVAIKWVDYFYSQEGYMKSSVGKNYRLANEGEIGFDGEQAIYAVDPAEALAPGVVQNSHWGDFAPVYVPLEGFIKRTYSDENQKIRNKNLYDAYQMYSPYAVNLEIVDFPMSADVAAEYLELRSAIGSAIDSGLASFVIGEQSIDADWDAYVQHFYDLGLERYLEICQNYLDGIK